MSSAWHQSVFSKAFRGVGRSLSRYWIIYGGIEAVLTSPFLLLAAFITLVCFPLWSHDSRWTSDAISIIPAMLGFSVGALAIILAFPSSVIFKELAEDGSPTSYFIGVAARLVHFIYVQVFSIFITILAKSYDATALSFFGFMFFCYSILSAAAVGMSFFGAAEIYNASARSPVLPRTKKKFTRYACYQRPQRHRRLRSRK